MSTDIAQQNVSSKLDTSIQPKEPQEKTVTDDSLMSFAKEIGLSTGHLESIQAVVDKVVAAIKQSSIKPPRIGVSESRISRGDKDESSVQLVVYVNKPEQVQQGQQQEQQQGQQQGQTQEAQQGQTSQQDVNAMQHVEDKALEEIKNVLNSLSVQNLQQDKQGLHFQLENVKFDVSVSVFHGHDKGIARQAVWRVVQTRDKDGKLHKEELEKFSTSLSDSMDDVLKPMDDFEKDALRLARAWRQAALPGIADFSPLSTQLVMNNALHRRRRRGRRDPMLNVMRDFFNELEDISNMNLVFPDFYDMGLVPQWVREERPLLLDPVLPWHNMLRGISGRSLSDISRQARLALSLLDSDSPSLSRLFGGSATTRGA
jgi:hypothetical protein